MAMGRRKEERQDDLFIPRNRLARSEGHTFYRKLNMLLAEAGFDRLVKSCASWLTNRVAPADSTSRQGSIFACSLSATLKESIVSGASRGVAMIASLFANSWACRWRKTLLITRR